MYYKWKYNIADVNFTSINNYLSYESYACNRFFPFSVYNKLEKTNFTSINELPKIEYTDDIFQKLTTLNKDGFALKKIQPLYIKIGDNNYSRVLY